MPLKSEAQRRFLHAAEARGEVPSGLAEKYEHATPKKVKERLPYHVKKHATVLDLQKRAEPDPDRDNNVDDEGETRTNKDTDYKDSENFYGHGKGVKGKKMNTVKDLMKKKAGAGDDLAKSLQGVRDNAKKTMGAIKPVPGSIPEPKPAPTPEGPAKTAADGLDGASAGQGLADAIGKVKSDAAAKIKSEKTPAPKLLEVKMGPPQGIRASAPSMSKGASAAFSKLANRGDAMFFGKGAGRGDGMFFKQANEVEGYGAGSVGDALASNPASGAISGGMGHGKGVKGGAEKKGVTATAKA